MHPSCNYSVPSYSKQSLENVTLLQKVVNSSHLAALVIAQCTLIALALNAHLWHSWVVNAVADSTYWSDANKVCTVHEYYNAEWVKVPSAGTVQAALEFIS